MGEKIAERLRRLDWSAIGASILERGYAHTPRLLTRAECRDVIALYPDDANFRKRIDMERHRFGVGDYAYFSEPLPPLVQELRTHGYRHLAPLADRMAEALGRPGRYPRSHAAYRRACAERGQTRPTPLVLRYGVGGYNCLHSDLYGDMVFPLQLACFLSRPGVDYEGGAFLLVEQRPRAQSIGDALMPDQGEAVIFATAERPSRGKRGFVRTRMRHGVGRLTRGSRYTLGIIFHDAR